MKFEKRKIGKPYVTAADWREIMTEYKADNTCEWIKYDYRTMCPKNHGDVDNPYWRIPTDMKHLLYCPYCGKRIRTRSGCNVRAD